MRSKSSMLVLFILCGFSCVATAQICPPRPDVGTAISNPLDLYSQNGTLVLNLVEKSEVGPTGFTHYCYLYMNGVPVEAPTLRLNPGDTLVINFRNNIAAVGKPPKSRHLEMPPMEMGDAHAAMATGNDCLGGLLTLTTTNIHFHGLNVPPLCHQDDVVKTVIPAFSPPFQYSIRIPENDPPGLYWYHPHPHGYTARQVYGGASGAIIIEGQNPLTQGLPERILMLRRNVDAVTDDDGQFTLNFEPANFPRRPLPIINMVAGQKEFWRFVNATTNSFLSLQVLSPAPQNLLLLSVDGIPLATPQNTTTIYVPPAGRVEFIVPSLSANTFSYFYTNGFNTGPIGDPMPPAYLAQIVVGTGNSKTLVTHQGPPPIAGQRFSGLTSVEPTTKRALYFSETNLGTNGPGQFYITVNGQKPRLFEAKNPPAIVTKIGAVEDWTISNRTGEPHAFHIHQLHFLVLEINGQPVPSPYLSDTITVPPWTGSGPYTSVKLRMDFRDSNIAGKFVYHCHILDHEDAGMMATIQVNK